MLRFSLLFTGRGLLLLIRDLISIDLVISETYCTL